MNRRAFLNTSLSAAAGLAGIAAFARPAAAQALWSDGPNALLSPGGGSVALTANMTTAPATDTTVYITANSTGPTAQVPNSVVIPAGQTSAPYTLIYGPQVNVTDSITVNLSANGGVDTGSSSFLYPSAA